MNQSTESTESTIPATARAGSTEFLKGEEAQILLDWERSEELIAGGDAGVARVHAIVKEIDDLVGHRLDLVADDLEERMIALLVGDLDPKSQICLEISRDVAQVTAEKDHLEGPELVRRFTRISSHTLRLTEGTSSSAAATPASTVPAISASAADVTSGSASATATSPASLPVAARSRPIPRPTKYPPRKPSLLQRLFGRQ